MENIENLKYSFYEISEILLNIPIEYSKKVPEKFKTFINDNKIDNGFVYNKDKTLNKQEILHDTKILLSIMYRNYWCTDEIRKKLEDEDNKILKEKFSYTELFKENSKLNDYKNTENKFLEPAKEQWYYKLINLIKKFIKRFK